MAASMAVAASSASVIALQKQSARLSSSSAFGAPLVSTAPLRPAAKQHLIVARAALPEEKSSRIARREILAGLVAVGAAFTTVSNVKAGEGPGDQSQIGIDSGPGRAQRQAEDLLKAADELQTKDSPPRYGSGEAGSANDPGAADLTQQAGSGAIKELQGESNIPVEKAPEGLEKLKQNFQQLFDSGNAEVPPILQEGTEQVKSDLSGAKAKVKSDISSAKSAASGAGSGLPDAPDAGGAADKAKSLVADTKSSGGNFIEDLTSKAKELLPQ